MSFVPACMTVAALHRRTTSSGLVTVLQAAGRLQHVADHLRPAAGKAGVHIEDGQRFRLRNWRHSLSNGLVNKAKVEPKTVQGILRHAKIQTTLDLYTQEDNDETRAAQGEFLTAVGMSTTVELKVVG